MSSILPHADRSRFRGANPAHTAIHCYPMRPSRSGNSESSLPAGLESVNRRIATLSKRKTDPLHNKIMDFALRRQVRVGKDSNERHPAVTCQRAPWMRWKGLARICGAWPCLRPPGAY